MKGFKTSPLDIVKVGFIGLGYRGMLALERYTRIEGSRIAAICDGDPERIRAAKSLVDYSNGVSEYSGQVRKIFPKDQEAKRFMDHAMDYRLVHCLRNGLPLDMDVYDAAEWSCISELSHISISNGSVPVPFPDFLSSAE